MKYLGCFLLLIIFTANSSAWVAHGIRHNPANPGKCTINDSLIIAPGDSVKDPEGCAQIDCEDTDGSIQIRGCGVVAPPPNCEWGDYIDMHAPYAECCERHLICKDAENQTMSEAADLVHQRRVLQIDAFEQNGKQALNVDK